MLYLLKARALVVIPVEVNMIESFVGWNVWPYWTYQSKYELSIYLTPSRPFVCRDIFPQTEDAPSPNRFFYRLTGLRVSVEKSESLKKNMGGFEIPPNKIVACLFTDNTTYRWQPDCRKKAKEVKQLGKGTQGRGATREDASVEWWETAHFPNEVNKKGLWMRRGKAVREPEWPIREGRTVERKVADSTTQTPSVGGNQVRLPRQPRKMTLEGSVPRIAHKEWHKPKRGQLNEWDFGGRDGKGASLRRGETQTVSMPWKACWLK